MSRFPFRAVPLLVLFLPAVALGQTGDHDNVEVIEKPKGPLPEPKADLAKVKDQITARTNVFREKEARKAVAVSKELSEAAELFARYMAKEDRYGHTADGKRPADRAKDRSYEYCIVLENIAYQYHSRDFETEVLSAALGEGWERSPGHRKNLRDPDVTQIGVGVARSEKTGYYYAVQMFGRPKSLAVEFSITNRSGDEVAYTMGEEKFVLGVGYTRTHTRCRPSEAALTIASGKGEPETVKPASGARYVVTREGDKLTVKREQTR